MARPTTMTGAWGAMEQAAGGVAPLAKLLGVSPVTVWRWANGGNMYEPTKLAIKTVAKQLKVKSPV